MATVDFDVSLLYSIHFPITFLLPLRNSIELGFNLNLVQSINTIVPFSNDIKYHILHTVGLNARRLKQGIDGITKLQFSLSMSYHIHDDTTGISYGGSYYLDKTHGITL